MSKISKEELLYKVGELMNEVKDLKRELELLSNVVAELRDKK